MSLYVFMLDGFAATNLLQRGIKDDTSDVNLDEQASLMLCVQDTHGWNRAWRRGERIGSVLGETPLGARLTALAITSSLLDEINAHTLIHATCCTGILG